MFLDIDKASMEEQVETLNGENARLRGALQNVVMMLIHNQSPDKTVKWIQDVLSIDLTKDDVDGNDLYIYEEKS